MDFIRSQNTPYFSWDFDLKMWFRARKVTGTFEKRAPGPEPDHAFYWHPIKNEYGPCSFVWTVYLILIYRHCFLYGLRMMPEKNYYYFACNRNFVLSLNLEFSGPNFSLFWTFHFTLGRYNSTSS